MLHAIYDRTRGKGRANTGGAHSQTSISGDTRADWSEVFALVPSLEVAYVGSRSDHLPNSTPADYIEPGTMTEATLLRLPELFEATLADGAFHLRLSDVSMQGELSGLLNRPGRWRMT